MALNRRILGKSGIEVTELCFGTLVLGHLQADLPPEEGAKAVRRALEQGANFIDTAKGYKTYEHTRLGMEGFRDVVIASKSPVKTAGEMRARCGGLPPCAGAGDGGYFSPSSY